MWIVFCLLFVWTSVAFAAPVIDITPATDLQAAITANPAGTVFRLTAGTHRRGSLTPKNGNGFVGAAGAILSGGEVLTGWTADGADFFVGGQTQQGSVVNASACLPGFEQCANPEDVFLNGVPLQGVANRAALGAGKFFFDYAADRIYLRDNPSGQTVETSVRANAFTGTAQNVRLINLTIEKYATPTQQGAINVSPTSHGWLIEGCVIQHNHSWGIHVNGSGWTIRGNTITTNGHIGVGGSGGKNTLIEGNILTANNYARINPVFEAGGVKLTRARSARLLRNQVSNNYGAGLWCDISCVDLLYAHNVVTGNFTAGIFQEISYRAVIRHNTSLDNGPTPGAWMYDGQIQVSNSERVEVYGNVVRVLAVGGTGIVLIQQDRGALGLWGPYRTRTNAVHHNTLRYPAGTSFNTGFSGLADDFYNDAEELGNTWDANVSFNTLAAPVWVWSICPHGYGVYVDFQACGHNTHGVRYDP